MNGQVNRRLDGKLGALHGLSFVDFTVLLELSRNHREGSVESTSPRSSV